MAYCEKRTITLTLTGGNTTGTAYSPVVNGRIVSIRYIPGSGTKLEGASGDYTIAVTGESSGVQVWSEAAVTGAKTVRPTWGVHDDAGVADPSTRDAIYLSDERLAFAVSNADANSSGSWELTIEGAFKGA